MVHFTVLHNNGRDVWLETTVTVDSPDAMERMAKAERRVDEALSAAAETFPPEWSRHLCDWCRLERWGGDGHRRAHFVVRMPVPQGRYVLALQEPETEAMREAAT
jgi:hypothetical protein